MSMNRRTFLKSSLATGLAVSFPHVVAAQQGRTYRTALIGCGWWGTNILREAAASGRCKIVALVDVDRRQLAKCTEEVAKWTSDTPKHYEDYREMLAAEKPDLVSVCVPNVFHKPMAIAALQHGKHVLCEKPMALTREDCLEMISACEENGVKLMEAFMYRFTTRVRILKGLLDSGAVGEVRHINSTFSFLNSRTQDVRFDPAMGGGSLWDVGCYPINLIGMIMGEEPVSLCAQKTERHGVDFSLSAVMKYRSGAICTANCGFDADSALVSEINGITGSILMRDSFHETDTPILLIKDGAAEEIPVPACKRYVLEVEDFADAVITGREPGFSLRETVRNVGLITRILEAAV